MNININIIATVAVGCYMTAGAQAAETTYSNVAYTQENIVVSGENTAIFSHSVEDTFTDFIASSVSATNGGALEFKNPSVFTNASNLSIDAYSSLKSGLISIDGTGSSMRNEGSASMGYLIVENGATAVNYGTITDATPNTDAEWDDNLTFEENEAAMGDNLLDVISKGSFTNYGSIDSITTVLDGEFIAQDKSTMGSVCLGMWYEDEEYAKTFSSLKVNGTVTMTGDLESYFYSEIVFTMDASIDMQGNSLIFEGGKIVLLYDGDLTDSTVINKNDFFVNYTLGMYNVDYGDDMVVTVVGTNNVSREMTIKELSSTVPEPATATLSLLALAGLAARRRRK